MQSKLDTLTRLVHGLIKESEPCGNLPADINLPLHTIEQLEQVEVVVKNDQTVRATLVSIFEY